MSKRSKRYQRIAQNPNNVMFDDLRKLLEDYGFEHRRTRGSHHSFVGWIGDEKISLVIPYRKPLKEVYVKKALTFIEQIRALNAEPEDEDEADEQES
jgi:predicted RNA binding protein YcfA (HicA-like mRNA interferase family)